MDDQLYAGVPMNSTPMELPIIEIFTSATSNGILGVVSDASMVSYSLPPYRLRVYSHIKDDGVTRWQNVFIGYFKTLDEAADEFRDMSKEERE